MGTVKPGTYRIDFQESPSPRGKIADLTMKLPSSQLYTTNFGSLTIDESTLIKSQRTSSLYHIKETFQAVVYAYGIGITECNPSQTSSFDLLLLAN